MVSNAESNDEGEIFQNATREGYDYFINICFFCLFECVYSIRIKGEVVRCVGPTRVLHGYDVVCSRFPFRATGQK